MSAPAAIETTDLTKVYRTLWRRREVRAVDGVSLRIEPGTSFGLLGPNGAGKTTFVKMLLAVARPTAGAARLFGLDCHRPEARRPVGYLPENHRLPGYLTGSGMLDFYAGLSGMAARERQRRAAELLALVGLEKWGGTRLSRYSKGMLQRLGLAQALMHRPRLLVLDEPSDGVDPVGRRQIREILQELEQQGVTVFINSHLLAEVELFCREVAILHRGRVALLGKVKELTAGKGYKLSAAGVSERLEEELRRRAAAASSADGLLEVQFASREEANQAVDLLRREGCEIESLAPTSSTLEEVFMRTIHA
jgi:ABC-2 type transport system ATP-binding protein